ncbi:conserved Plasmodium protein, unknown function [Plasmodium gallinaceum]|uniref:Uncharacterized protein n=1 Tax=Plasmodium gallinaceum TaxID=5849 RepID=A0A1J1GWA2_PLAGA|nr:conserved Plasmodium protein, unknown function [Plasmodium gallinaceum]CRG96750.1 conserved Plasmodium protein, unknown function [Plasmodium gallinaceum]
MSILYSIFPILFFFSFNKKIYGLSKIIKPHINVYYKDYSENLPSDEKDKLMKILLENDENEENENISENMNIEKMEEKEKNLEILMKEQENLSNKIYNELKGYIKRDRNISIKYVHDEEDFISEDKNNLKKDENILNVDTEINGSLDSLQAPIVMIKIPSVNIYNQFEIQRDIGKLIDLNNEELFY